MSVVPPPQPGSADAPQGPWDRRSVHELSQTSFRTALRGYDREEVRAVLESVAADYRVLQLQNASLQRQLADLEAVLQAYQDRHPDSGSVASSQALQRANSEARSILMRAYADAEETMVRINALTKGAERPPAKLEPNHGNFRVSLASSVSELMAILQSAEQNPEPFVQHEYPAPVVHDAAAADVAPAPVEAPAIPLGDHRENDSTVAAAPTRSAAPLEFAPRNAHRRRAADAHSEPLAARDPMDAILKELDKAMVELPILPGD